jgi:hypothetical protein
MKTLTRQFWLGAIDGALATLAMGVGMALIWLLGRNVMPEPIPLALVARLVARTLHMTEVTSAAVLLAVPIFFAYGALWGGLVATSTRRVTWSLGAALGLGLWLVMVIFWLPIAGRWTFQVASSPLMWISTLVLHLVYGLTLVPLIERHHAAAEEMA